ncbi:VOC family protein [Hymenobacter sp. GOD-10R]|uniref:VOC family protein n=1 Tax=Hymenobacter sp. GOD-10R TaxID=3093922 RepID=UPI002D76BFD3|nr:VOC family protein [Hymenobacter sp. GOD-10R]WRQ27062.1 VOC family protein [Hymenobacter sp. GOD-10R]
MKIVLFLLTLICGLSVSQVVTAQTKSRLAPVFNHSAVCVQDLKRSTTFYRTVLMLEEIPNPFNDGLHTWLSIGPGIQLHIIQRQCTPNADKNIHMCFKVPVLAEFISHLEKLGVAYTNLKGEGKDPTLRADGVKQIYLQDPDGYWIEINDAK